MCKVTTAERLKEWMEKTGSRQVDILERAKPFCEKYGVKLTKSALSQYISGKSEPHQDKLFILGCALNVDEAWLMGYQVAPERKHSDTSEHFNTISTDFNRKRNEKIIEMKLSDSELDMIRRYRELDDYGKNAVDSLLKTEFERCTDSDNVIHLSKEILEQLPMSIRLPLLQYQDEEYELRVARKNRRESK